MPKIKALPCQQPEILKKESENLLGATSNRKNSSREGEFLPALCGLISPGMQIKQKKERSEKESCNIAAEGRGDGNGEISGQ